MASESTAPPPPPSGGNLKYAIIGVALLAGAVVLFLLYKGCDSGPGTEPHAQAHIDAGTLERVPDINDDLVIPELVPDSGPTPDAGVRIRYVTRYVGGGGGGAFSCSGNINTAAAARVVQENNVQFRNCYERRLKVNNHLEGHVTVQMRVSHNGSVDGVQVGGNLGDREVFSCVRAIANRLHFPVPAGGACAVVSAPFNFTPQH